MKNIYICIFASILLVAKATGVQYHSFTDLEGRKLEAKILSFDNRSGKIELERQDGKTFKVKPSLFSESDQDYILKWITANQVLSEENLRISFRKMKAKEFQGHSLQEQH